MSRTTLYASKSVDGQMQRYRVGGVRDRFVFKLGERIRILRPGEDNSLKSNAVVVGYFPEDQASRAAEILSNSQVSSIEHAALILSTKGIKPSQKSGACLVYYCDGVAEPQVSVPLEVICDES